MEDWRRAGGEEKIDAAGAAASGLRRYNCPPGHWLHWRASAVPWEQQPIQAALPAGYLRATCGLPAGFLRATSVAGLPGDPGRSKADRRMRACSSASPGGVASLARRPAVHGPLTGRRRRVLLKACAKPPVASIAHVPSACLGTGQAACLPLPLSTCPGLALQA